MNLVQRALANLLAVPVANAVATATSDALTETRSRLAALEARPTLTDAERETIAKAGQLVAQFEAAAAGQFDPAPPAEQPPAEPAGGVTVEDVPAP